MSFGTTNGNGRGNDKAAHYYSPIWPMEPGTS
jgi:hypothetical protein